MPTKELKSCPLCGSKAQFIMRPDLDVEHRPAKHFQLGCSKSDCIIPGSIDWDEERAITAWNRRTPATLMGDVGKLVARLRDAQNSDVTLDLTIGNCGDLGLAIDALLLLSAQVEQMAIYKESLSVQSAPGMECDAAFEKEFGLQPTNHSSDLHDIWCDTLRGWRAAWQYLIDKKK